MKKSIENFVRDYCKLENKIAFIEKADEEIDFYDFDRVEKVMKTLDWHWLGTEEAIPQQWEMKKLVRNLIVDCFTEMVEKGETEYFMGTGGFEVSTWIDEAEQYNCQIKFSI